MFRVLFLLRGVCVSDRFCRSIYGAGFPADRNRCIFVGSCFEDHAAAHMDWEIHA